MMPQMGESIAEGTLSKWLKKVGDAVKRDEPIFEISTDKVDAEIPAPTAGVLVEILVTEGQTVPVQQLVARIETDASLAAGSAPGSGGSAVSAGSGDGCRVRWRRQRRGWGPPRCASCRLARSGATPGCPIQHRIHAFRRRARRPPAHEVVTAGPQDRRGARNRDRRDGRLGHPGPRDAARHRAVHPVRRTAAGRTPRSVHARDRRRDPARPGTRALGRRSRGGDVQDPHADQRPWSPRGGPTRTSPRSSRST
jgi:pyruvate/2-oxoglutarate dehydrogenase complex dihydrolipoamide acyltransferase (E2) component